MLIVVDGGRWDLPLLGAGVPFGLPFIALPFWCCPSLGVSVNYFTDAISPSRIVTLAKNSRPL
jgi:hypothetical protein